MDPVDLAQLCRSLNHEHDAHVVAGEVAYGLGKDGDLAKSGELIEEHHYLMLERGIAFRQLARLKPNRLLEEEIEHGTQAVQIIRVDADVDRKRLGVKFAQVKVTLRR